MVDHSHLPKSAAYRLINWGRETDRVTKSPNFEAAEVILQSLENTDEILPTVEVKL